MPGVSCPGASSIVWYQPISPARSRACCTARTLPARPVRGAHSVRHEPAELEGPLLERVDDRQQRVVLATAQSVEGRAAEALGRPLRQADPPAPREGTRILVVEPRRARPVPRALAQHRPQPAPAAVHDPRLVA